MRDDDGIESALPAEGSSRADRKHNREYIVVRAVVAIGQDLPITCGLMDISVSGAKIKFEDLPPPVGQIVVLSVEALKFRAKGTIIRTYQTPSGVEVALKFDREYSDVPSKLLDYKLKSVSKRAFR